MRLLVLIMLVGSSSDRPVLVITALEVVIQVQFNALNAVDVNSSVFHVVKILSSLQVPELVKETELSLLHESIDNDIEVLLRSLSNNLLAFVEHLDVDDPLFSLDGVRQLPH